MDVYRQLSPGKKKAVLVVGVFLGTLLFRSVFIPCPPPPRRHRGAGPDGAGPLSSGLALPDGGELVNLIVPAHEKAALLAASDKMPAVVISEEMVQWVDVLSTGWASPLRGFMTEAEYLQTIHFNSLLVDGKRVSMPIPIVLAISEADRVNIGSAPSVALRNSEGLLVAVLDNPDIYEHRKHERIYREFAAEDPGHPYISRILAEGPWLMGGSLRVPDRVRYHDGLDRLRLSPHELRREFERRGADAVVAFQTRNPSHAAHCFLMTEGLKRLKKEGARRPLLWLSPLGGWTKSDDVPLDVRVRQHEAILKAGMLPEDETVLAIWPSPMIYAGPTEVQWHAKSRRNAGAVAFITGRDPAGIKRTNGDKDDIYKGTDGKFVLEHSPGLGDMRIFSFPKIAYDKTISAFAYYDANRKDDFISISGSKMRALARAGEDPPVDGFMAPEGWRIVVEYYQSLK